MIYLRSLPNSDVYDTLYSVIETVIIYASLFVVVKGILLRGYGSLKLTISDKE